MTNTYPTPPAYTPGAGQGGYWYRPPFTPRFSIPQTFGEALSYEAQIHWLAGLCSDADAMLRTMSAMHFYYGTASVDTSAFTAYEPFTYTDASIPDADQPKVGDFVGLVVPDADTRYLGKNALHIARVVEWEQPCNKLTLAWYCTVHDADVSRLDGRINTLSSQVTQLSTKISKTLADIIAKIYGGGTVDPDTGAVTWGSGTTPIPVSTINIFSADANPNPASSAGLIAHAGVSDNDLWQK